VENGFGFANKIVDRYDRGRGFMDFLDIYNIAEALTSHTLWLVQYLSSPTVSSRYISGVYNLPQRRGTPEASSEHSTFLLVALIYAYKEKGTYLSRRIQDQMKSTSTFYAYPALELLPIPD
jgi:hypothetical protein